MLNDFANNYGRCVFIVGDTAGALSGDLKFKFRAEIFNSYALFRGRETVLYIARVPPLLRRLGEIGKTIRAK